MKSILQVVQNLLKPYIDAQDDALNNALSNVKDELTPISITGTTNNTGSTISSDTYFYLNGTLTKALIDIAVGATLTANTNYEVVTKGALYDLRTVIKNLKNITDQEWSTASIPTGIETEITSKTLDSDGTYIISFANAYNDSFSQDQYILMKWSSGDYAHQAGNNGTGTAGGMLSVCAIIHDASSVRFLVRQNSGSSHTCKGHINIFRLS